MKTIITVLAVVSLLDPVYSLNVLIGYSNKATYTVKPNTDTYHIIQQSLDDISNARGGVLWLEKGTYILSSGLEIGSNTAIIGAGINDTILKLEDRAKPFWDVDTKIRKSGLIRSKGTENLYFTNFTLDGNKINQNNDEYSIYGRYGLYTEAVDNVVVDSVGIINFQGYGFDPHGVKSPKTWSIGLIIVNSYAAHNDWDGFTIDQSTDVLLQNNIAHNNGRHGFNIVTGSFDVTILNNLAYNNGFYYYLGDLGCGLAVQNNLDFGTKRISIIGNIFNNNHDAGICLRDVSNILVQNNTISNINYTDPNVSLCIESYNNTNVITQGNVCGNKNEIIYTPLPLSRKLPSFTNISSQNISITPILVSSSSINNKCLSFYSMLILFLPLYFMM